MYRCYYFDDKDGLEHNYLLQLECKLDIDFNDKDERAKTILQVICYIKQIHDSILGYSASWESNAIPKVIMIGSKINCFALPAKLLLPYAQGPIQNFKSASTAYTQPENQVVLQRIKNDTQIDIHSIVYSTESKDCIDDLCKDIAKLGRDLQITDDLSESTVSKAFDFFDMYVLDNKFAKNKTSREKVAMFIGIFFSDEFSETTSGRGSTSIDRIHINGIEIKVNPDYYNKFKLLYSVRDYSRLEQKQITAITDRLLEDTDRRRKGDFYTPTIWVDEAHKLLDKNLGANWRDEYIVWDCAWGTGNLTRDYNFKDLYCSTINQEELNIGMRYNKNATKFQYDFLNDDVEEFEQARATLRSPFRFKSGIDIKAMEQYINFKDILELYSMAVDKGIITLEEGQSAYNRAVGILKSTKLYKCAHGLVESLIDGGEQGKKLLFFINPPYGTSGEMSSAATGKEKKSGIAESMICEYMRDNKIGACSQQLYAQFLYRIDMIASYFGMDTYTGIFCPPLVMSGKQYDIFRSKVLINSYVDGFLFQASQFANVKSGWGISFTIWNKNRGNNVYKMGVKTYESGNMETIQDKTVYYTNSRASDWVKSSCNDYKEEYKTFTMSNALTVTDGICGHSDKILGWAMINQNIPESNMQFVMLMNRRLKGHLSAYPITYKSYFSVISYYTARKLITPNWINSKDEYMIPNIESGLWDRYCVDSIVYAIFNNATNIASLRNLSGVDIYNQFFWLSKSYMRKLAGGEFSKDDINTAIEDDLEYSQTVDLQGFKYPTGDKIDIEGFHNDERYVHILLTTINKGLMSGCSLSEEAKNVLSKATEILKKTFKFRKQFNLEHPEYHINTWDAGWYQIKALAKEYTPDDLKEFNDLYKALGDRMRPLVYELGFLYK